MKLAILKQVSLVKTIYFNFKMFPLRLALKFPVFIGHYTKFVSLRGGIHINSVESTGMIRFGFGDVGIIDKKNVRTIIELNGIAIFGGIANFGSGSRISIGEKGVLKIGNRFNISANSTIICFDSIVLENDVLFSWDILMMDTDFHETINTITKKINSGITRPIKIGANTWIGTRCVILKGTVIPANTIVGAGSLLNKKYDILENCLLAGNPAIVKAQNIAKHLLNKA